MVLIDLQYDAQISKRSKYEWYKRFDKTLRPVYIL